MKRFSNEKTWRLIMKRNGTGEEKSHGKRRHVSRFIALERNAAVQWKGQTNDEEKNNAVVNAGKTRLPSNQ